MTQSAQMDALQKQMDALRKENPNSAPAGTENSSNPQPVRFGNIDTKVLNENRKTMVEFILKHASDYVHAMVPTETKKCKFGPQCQDQLLYLLWGILEAGENIPDDIDTEALSAKKVMDTFETNSENYMIFQFMHGVCSGYEYSGTDAGSAIECAIMVLISSRVEDEDLQVFLAQMFVTFLRRFTQALANYNWSGARSINAINTNALLRNMDTKGTNPLIFNSMYDYSMSRKGKK
jgi:hypothetical protein